jgi:hypothetical protein
MKTSKIKINPVTMEIEIEVSDTFLEKYFEKLTDRFPKSKKRTPKIRAIKTKAGSVPKVKKGIKKVKPTTVMKDKKKGSIQNTVFKVIKDGKDECVSLNEIVRRTGLKKLQVYGVIRMLKTKGMIKTAGRGLFICTKDNEQLSPPPDMND